MINFVFRAASTLRNRDGERRGLRNFVSLTGISLINPQNRTTDAIAIQPIYTLFDAKQASDPLNAQGDL